MIVKVNGMVFNGDTDIIYMYLSESDKINISKMIGIDSNVYCVYPDRNSIVNEMKKFKETKQ